VAWLAGNAASSLAQEGAAAAAGAATILTVEGQVEVFKVGAQDWAPARTNQTLLPKELLRTRLRSRATLRLADQTILRVDQLTTLEIQPPAPERGPVLNLQRGAAYLFNREAPSEIEFRTPLASGAIRGTEFNLEVAEEGRTVVTMIDGEVELRSGVGRLKVATGEQGVVDPGQPPRKRAVLDAVNVIQWSLYYPGVLDVDELGLDAEESRALADSLAAYRAGDLLQAVWLYPENRAPASEAETVYLAALSLAVGQVGEAERWLNEFKEGRPGQGRSWALGQALRQMMAAVKFQVWERSAPPQLATEWMAESYYQQSRSRLEEARTAARHAVGKSPQFGFAHARLAELEFSFGRTAVALAALNRALNLCPRHAQAYALNGFLLAAQNRLHEAELSFEHAIALDGSLGNAWLGRGLVRIRRGRGVDGRRDLQVAATLEPHRALLRSYLGKAYANVGEQARAEKELALARRLDPNDPTAWLYSALLQRQQNRVNEAVEDLEHAQELNDHRSVFRSRLLLDQDRAARSANLAAVYRDAGLLDAGVREATRAVNADYANYSAHAFLANAYNELRDPRQINLRYETPWFSEWLLANLLAPVGASTLSRHVSQQEYSRLLERDGLGVISLTEYFSSGDWLQAASQYGTFGNVSYALDVAYRSERGLRPNADLEQVTGWVTVKYQLTPQDSVLVLANYYHAEAGDVAPYYNFYGRLTNAPAPSFTQRLTENQEPNVFVGYHREWTPGVHTLLLAGRLDDTFTRRDRNAPFRVLSLDAAGNVTRVNDYFQPVIPRATALDYESQLEAYSVELQQIVRHGDHTVIGGGRYQSGWLDTRSRLAQAPNTGFPVFLQHLDVRQRVEADLQRLSLYGYYAWQVLAPLQVIAGVSYDRLEFPLNSEIAPLAPGQADADQVSPKAGVLWTPWADGAFRFAYTRSLGGVFYDTSVRLEPTQVAGLNQAFRSLIPESVVGLVPGSRFTTYGVSFEQKLPTRTYFSVAGDLLESEASRAFGVFHLTGATNLTTATTPQRLDFREKTLTVTVNQLVGDSLALGAVYRRSEAELNDRFPAVPPGTPVVPLQRDVRGVLQQLNLFSIVTHPSGAFGQVEGVWTRQSNHGYTPDLPGDDFWQLNAYVGWRFLRRRAEVRLGLLNLTDQDYRLNPLNLHAALPRQRTLAARLKFNF
jgi:tetratricopeptide (TPR) repeat protein